MNKKKYLFKVILVSSLMVGSVATFFISAVILFLLPSGEPIPGGFMFDVRNAMEDWDEDIVKLVPNKQRPEWCVYQSFAADGGYYEIQCFQKLATEGEQVKYSLIYCQNEPEVGFSCDQTKTVSYTESEAAKLRRYYGDEEPSKEDKQEETKYMTPFLVLMLGSLLTAFVVVPSLCGYWLILWALSKIKKKPVG